MLTGYQGQSSCDADLLQLFRNQDKHAFDVLYKKYWNPLLHFAKHYIDDPDTCEELVQDLFVHLHGKPAPIEIHYSLSAYLFRAMRNRISNHVRNAAVYKKHIRLAVHSRAKDHNNVEQFVSYSELKKEIAFSVNQMPEKCREVYLLHEQHHYTVKKIASILNRPVDTVEKQFRKAIALLRLHLKPIRAVR